MARIHVLNLHRQTLSELMGYSSFIERIVLFPILLCVKLFRLRSLPTSCDDPPIDKLSDVEVSPQELPDTCRNKMKPMADELERLGFKPSICHSMRLPNQQTELYRAYYLHPAGETIAFINYRHWIPQSKHRLFVSFLTSEKSGKAVLTTNGRLDCHHPAKVHVERKVAEPIEKLLVRHEDAVRQNLEIPLRLSRDAHVRQVVEYLHEKFRQFQLERGFYSPIDENGPKAEKIAQRASRTSTSVSDEEGLEVLDDDLENPQTDGITEEIVRLMDETTNKKSSWTQNILLLVVTLGIFVATSLKENDWSWTGMLIPVLLVHELGHLFAMRACGYQNTKIFFIPLLGAAASGVNFNVPGWKRVLVALAGPIPGLAIGILVGVAGVMYQQPLMVRFGEISCVLNAFNLIPILPIDGGWVAFYTLFCRHPLLDAAFRACGAFVLFLVAIFLNQIPLGIMAAFFLMNAYRAFKIGDVARRLQAEGVETESEDLATINHELATRVVNGIRRVFANSPKTTNQILATSSLEAYSLIHSRPPRWFASLFFIAVQTTGFFVGIAGLIGFTVADRANLGQIFNAALRQPAHDYPCGSSEKWSGPEATTSSEKPIQIVAFCDSVAGAKRRFDESKAQMPPTAKLSTVGPYLYITLPPDAEQAREQEVERLTNAKLKFNVITQETRSPGYRVMGLAPGKDEASSIATELSNFSSLGNMKNLIPPWSVRWQAGGPEIDAFRKARAAFVEIQKTQHSNEEYDREKAKQLQQKSRNAIRLGRREEAQKLQEEISQLFEDARISAMEKVIANTADEQDRQTMQLYIEWQKESDAAMREQQRKGRASPEDIDAYDPSKLESFRQLQDRLGAVSENDAETSFVTAETFMARNSDLVVEIMWIRFTHEDAGLQSMLEWLCGKHCHTIKIEASPFGMFDEFADDEE